MRVPVDIPMTTVATIAAAVLVSACASSSHRDPAQASEPGTPSSAVNLLTYRCESDALIRATYPTDSVALVRYDGATHEMRVARAASGVRYVGDGLQWWTKGNGPGASGTLSRSTNTDEAGGEIIEECREVRGDS